MAAEGVRVIHRRAMRCIIAASSRRSGSASQVVAAAVALARVTSRADRPAHAPRRASADRRARRVAVRAARRCDARRCGDAGARARRRAFGASWAFRRPAVRCRRERAARVNLAGRPARRVRGARRAFARSALGLRLRRRAAYRRRRHCDRRAAVAAGLQRRAGIRRSRAGAIDRAQRCASATAGCETLRALGIRLAPDVVQVSFNLTDVDAIPLYRVRELVRLRGAPRRREPAAQRADRARAAAGDRPHGAGLSSRRQPAVMIASALTAPPFTGPSRCVRGRVILEVMNRSRRWTFCPPARSKPAKCSLGWLRRAPGSPQTKRRDGSPTSVPTRFAKGGLRVGHLPSPAQEPVLNLARRHSHSLDRAG